MKSEVSFSQQTLDNTKNVNVNVLKFNGMPTCDLPHCDFVVQKSSSEFIGDLVSDGGFNEYRYIFRFRNVIRVDEV